MQSSNQEPGQRLTGIARLWRAFVNSCNGFSDAIKEETAVQQECLLLLVAIPAAFWLTGDTIERVLLVSSVVLVLIVELLNTGIEAAIDRIGTEYHELSGKAKDVGSAAVLVALCLAAVVWIMILV